MGLLFREHPKAPPGGGFLRSPGSNLRPLVYKVSILQFKVLSKMSGKSCFLVTRTVHYSFMGDLKISF